MDKIEGIFIYGTLVYTSPEVYASGLLAAFGMVAYEITLEEIQPGPASPFSPRYH